MAKNKFIFTRHSKALYKSYGKGVASENPSGPHNIHDQIVPDVPKEGMRLAKDQAHHLLKELDPEKDVLFFVSSHESRALETAYYYVSVAHKLGFEVIEHKTGVFGKGKVTYPTIEQVEKRLRRKKHYVRPLHALSLEIPNNFEGIVFNSSRALGYLNINWDNISQEDKERWAKARKIIESHDYGTWGGNFYHHAKDIKKIFPDIDTPYSDFQHKFKRLVKLVKWGIENINEQQKLLSTQSFLDSKKKTMKNVVVMAFGHENYWGYALNEYFHDNNIGNCQSVAVGIDKGEYFLEKVGFWG